MVEGEEVISFELCEIINKFAKWRVLVGGGGDAGYMEGREKNR